MSIIEITAGELLPGDVLFDLGVGAVEHFTVEGTQRLGPLVLIDFADDTSTPPILAAVPVRVRRVAK